MSFFRYLRDNVRFIVLYFALTAFLVTAAFLDAQSRMQPGNAAYVAVVSVLLFVACVAVDYGIRRRQAIRLAELVRSRDRTPVLPEPACFRDEQYAELIRGLYAGYMESIGEIEEDFKESKEFMAAWAHEVKTPITAARLLLEGGPDEQALASLAEELDRISESVEKVLFYTRSDSFSKDYIISEETLERLVKECVKKHSAIFIKKRIRIAIDIPEELSVQTDRKWLLFIMDQLVSNALKYTAAGGILTVSALQDEREAVLRLKDDGRGIPKEDIGRVFAKSFTGRQGREEGSAATGLGLYLAQKLARKLNHFLTISSEFGFGTTAEIHFPTIDDELKLTKL